MRQAIPALAAAALLSALAGCINAGPEAPAGLDAVLGISAATPATNSDASATSSADGAPSAQRAGSTQVSLSGAVEAQGDYQLFDLGPSSAGDSWTISLAATGPMVVVLLDERQNLLYRSFLSPARQFQHTLRADAAALSVAVMPPASGQGGSFRINASQGAGGAVPAPAPALVWLDFGTGENIVVHGEEPISFADFDAAMIGESYAGSTAEIRDTIIQVLRDDYADFNVALLTSLDSPRPTLPCSVLYFGGDNPGLLGLADNVDNYNQRAAQSALVYVNGFAPYWTMQLSPAQMGVMIGNVASHELGHLLGLYHTSATNDTMDTTGGAWDLAGAQAFTRAALEATVFATGSEDSPTLLAQTVGVNSASKTVAQRPSRKIASYREIRQLSTAAASRACGTCLRLDE